MGSETLPSGETIHYCADHSAWICGGSTAPGGCVEWLPPAGFFPGPCGPWAFCMADLASGLSFTPADTLLPETVAGLLDLPKRIVSATETPASQRPPITPQTGSALDARGFRTVVGIAGPDIVILAPGGQSWRAALAPVLSAP